ncbi:MAG: nucleoside triphosphate pyrophosphatase [Neisseria sp.]|nr:nucleoside triphosphate pyrophosphatase [Neisseria sp.]
MNLPLILASTSRFRHELLSRLALPFQAAAPQCDETPLPDEAPQELALRLAEGKAHSLTAAFPQALIIGSDQVAFALNRSFGKPGTLEQAACMLRELSGQTLTFYTALVVLNSAHDRIHRHTDITRVKLRVLSDAVIERYLEREPDAVHCAGGAKSESLGMSLIERIDSSDPNALIGLPMLRLVDFLLEEGITP